MGNINTLEQVADILETLGYEVELHAHSVLTKIGGSENPFFAVLTIAEASKELIITCQLATLGDINENEDGLLKFTISALDVNTSIRPFAFAIISDTDDSALDNEQQWPIVLTDSLPLGDLSERELEAGMRSLLAALAASSDVLRIGLVK